MEGKRVLIVARLKILDVTQNSICFFLPLIAGNPYGVGNWTNRWIWSSYSDLTRPHPKWWYSKGNPLISGKSGLVKYWLIWPDECPEDNGTWGMYFSFERCFSAAFTHPTRQRDSQVHSELDHFAFLSRGSTLILRRNVRWRNWKAPTLTHIMDVHEMYPQKNPDLISWRGWRPWLPMNMFDGLCLRYYFLLSSGISSEAFYKSLCPRRVIGLYDTSNLFVTAQP